MGCRRSCVRMSAPRTAPPRTARSTNGKPWTATASSEKRLRYCAVTQMSATTATNVRAVSAQASAGRHVRSPTGSGAGVDHRGQASADPGAATRGGTRGERAAGRLDAVAQVRQTGAGRGGGRVEAHAVVLDHEAQPATASVEGDPDRGRSRVLGGVLHRLQAAEVRRRLDARRVPAHPRGRDLDRGRTPGHGRGEGGDQTVLAQPARVDAPREGHEDLDRLGRGVLLLGQQRVGPLARSVRERLGEAEVHGEGDEVLLGTVVDVALEVAALGVLGSDQALARDAQLACAGGELLEPTASARRAASPREGPGRPGRPGPRTGVTRPRTVAGARARGPRGRRAAHPPRARAGTGVPGPGRRCPSPRPPGRAPARDRWRREARSPRAAAGHRRPARPGTTRRRCRRRGPWPSATAAPGRRSCRSPSARTSAGRRTARAGRG